MSFDECETVLRKAFRSAGTSQGGQLSPETPVILVLACFHLREQDLALLEAAANREFEATGQRRQHVAAVGIVSLGVAVSGDGAFSTPQLSGQLSVRVARNPEYDGVTEISTEGRNMAEDATPQRQPKNERRP